MSEMMKCSICKQTTEWNPSGLCERCKRTYPYVGGVVITVENGTPIIQKYDKELQRYRRWAIFGQVAEI